MKAKKFSLVLVLILALSTFLAACSGKDDADGDKNTDGKKEEGKKVEQVLNLLQTSEIPSMDSTLATDQVSFEIMNNTNEGLYRLGENDSVELGLASGDPQISEDGKTWTIKLRDAKWSNGDEITAEDFVYSWKRVVDPATKAEYAYMAYPIKNAEAINTGKAKVDELGVKAVDAKTLEITLENAVPYFKSLLSFATFYPLQEKFVTAQGEKYGLEADTQLYNGPFVLSEWKHEQSFKLTKNPNYWDADTVKLETINFNIVKDVATGVNLYTTGKLERVGLSAEFVDKYKNDKEYGTVEDTSVYFLRLNQKNKALANVNLRKAIDAGYDKEALAESILNNGSIGAYFLVPKNFTADDSGVDFREANGDMNKVGAKGAGEYWEKAKKELGVDKVELTLLNYDSESAKKVGEYLKEQLETNLPGLTVNIKQQPFAQKLDLESAGDYDFSFAGWGPDYQDPMTFLDLFVTGGAHNQMEYSNPEYDKLVNASNTTLLTDLPTRWKSMQEAEKILIDQDQAISPVYQKGGAYLQKPTVHNLYEHKFGGDFSYKWVYIE